MNSSELAVGVFTQGRLQGQRESASGLTQDGSQQDPGPNREEQVWPIHPAESEQALLSANVLYPLPWDLFNPQMGRELIPHPSTRNSGF